MATKAIQVDFDEAAAPATPAAGDVRLYAKTDGLLYSKDDAGAETLVSGGTAGSTDLSGKELDYVQRTSDLALTATTEGTAQTVVTGASVAYDGSTIIEIEFYSPDVGTPNGGAGRSVIILLYEDSTLLGRFAVIIDNGTAQMRMPVRLSHRRTPTSGSKTHVVKAYTSHNVDAFVSGGSGGTGASLPCYMRITRVSS